MSAVKERQTALTIFVESHFQQNSKYGQKAEFNISVPVCGSGWAITKIIVKKTMTCRRTVKPQSDPDLSFSKDEIVIKRTNAQISGMEYFK